MIPTKSKKKIFFLKKKKKDRKRENMGTVTVRKIKRLQTETIATRRLTTSSGGTFAPNDNYVRTRVYT